MRYIYISKIDNSILGLCIKLIWVCMVVTPFIDSIVGYIMNISGGETAISKIFRTVFLFFLLFVIIVIQNKKKIVTYIMLLLYLLTLPIFYSIFNKTLSGIMTDGLYLSKLFFPIIYATALKLLNDRGYPIEKISLSLLRYLAIIYPISVIIPMLFNIGYKSYDTIGIMGFYSSGNEISIVLGIMFIVNFGFLRKKISVFNIVATIISGIIGILTASKAIILIYILLFAFILLKKQNRNTRNVIVIAMLFILFIILMNTFFDEEILHFINRLEFRYKQLGNSFWNLLFSNRNRKILPNFERNYVNSNAIPNFIFGRGAYYHLYTTKFVQGIAASGLIEMDFFDLLLQNGFIVFIIVSTFYYTVLKIRPYNEMFAIIKFSCIMMLLFSCLAGHVLYNPLSNTILALICSILKVHEKK